MTDAPLDAEWLRRDGQFASGTCRVPHAALPRVLLTSRRRAARAAAWCSSTDRGVGRRRRVAFALSTQHYAPTWCDPTARRGSSGGFHARPVADAGRSRCPDGTRHRARNAGRSRGRAACVAARGGSLRRRGAGAAARAAAALRARLPRAPCTRTARFVRSAALDGGNVTWRPYAACRAIAALPNGDLSPRARLVPQLPLRRGSGARARLRARIWRRPARSTFDLAQRDAIIVLRAARSDRRRRADALASASATPSRPRRARSLARSTAPPTRTSCARGSGRTIIAGYPVVRRLGPRHVHRAARPVPRDAGAFDDARVDPARVGRHASPKACCPTASPTTASAPEYNSVDASLWYRDRRPTSCWPRRRRATPRGARARSQARSTRSSPATRAARATASAPTTTACSRAACPGVQLTWMDAQGRRPRRHAAHRQAGRGAGAVAQRARGRAGAAPRCAGASSGRAAFARASGTPSAAACTTSSTSTTSPARVDASFRPNQIFAVGGLPLALRRRRRARARRRRGRARAADAAGLRSLAPGEPGYRPRYEGGVRERDGAYHQGTVWPWLIGPFVEAWVRVHGDTADAQARGARALPRAAAARTSSTPASATSPRSPTASRRTRRAAVRSRRGRSARCCGSTRCCADRVLTASDRARESRREGSGRRASSRR